MPLNESRMTAIRLMQVQRESHTSQHWQSHHYAHPVVINSVRYCLCADCYEEMIIIAEQWQRDYDSMMEDIRRSSEHFLGFDIYEEWLKKTTRFTPL